MTERDDIDALERTLWDFLRLGRAPLPCETILALGSMDTRVAERAAQLFLDRYAPRLIMSGGFGRLTGAVFDRPEAEMFAGIAIRAGVPPDAIIIENQSTNTSENITFTAAVLRARGLTVGSVLLVTQPILERRALATFQHQWPDTDARVAITSPEIDRPRYPAPGQSRDHLRAVMVGEVQRLRVYPRRGWLGPQEIPPAVWEAAEQLLAAGYDQYAVLADEPGNNG